ncbi:MAG: FlgD immunoglobulin-like domain containing protein [bacterium]
MKNFSIALSIFALLLPAVFSSAGLSTDTLSVEIRFDFREPVGVPTKVLTRFKARLECPTSLGADIRLIVEGEEGEAEKFCMAGAEKELVLREFVIFQKTLGPFTPGQIQRGAEIIEINAREDCTGETLGPATGQGVNPQNGRWICIQWLIMPCRGNEVKVLLQGRQMPRVENTQQRICPLPLRSLCDSGDFPVVINELMANNTATIADPQGEFDSWIELHNTLANTFDLSGMFLSNDSTASRKWRFPQGATIPGNGYLLIWADGDSLDVPGLHTSFTLSDTGGQILFLEADTGGMAVLDSVAFAAQTAGISFGRLTDGDTTFAVFTSSTPGRPNEQITAVRNERAGLPYSPELHQNYPNPFNPSTRIRYRLAAANHVELAIFSVSGQLVKRFLRKQQPAGLHVIDWDGRDSQGRTVPSGVYFYRLQAGQNMLVRKMLRVE